jgi:hypothetical protein
VVLSHHIKRYSHTLTHIHIHPQNNHHWSLCKSANVGIAAGNTAEKYLQEGPIWLPLWQRRSLWPTEINAHVAFLSSRERKRNRMVRVKSAWMAWQNGDLLFWQLLMDKQTFVPLKTQHCDPRLLHHMLA